MNQQQIINTMNNYGEGIIKAKHKENSVKTFEIEFSQGNYGIFNEKERQYIMVDRICIPCHFVIDIESY